MESRAKETAKKTAKKGKMGLLSLYSAVYLFLPCLFFCNFLYCSTFWHVNEQFKIFYDFIRIITVFLVLYIVNEKNQIQP